MTGQSGLCKSAGFWSLRGCPALVLCSQLHFIPENTGEHNFEALCYLHISSVGQPFWISRKQHARRLCPFARACCVSDVTESYSGPCLLTETSVPSARLYSKVTPRVKSSSRVRKLLDSLIWNLSPVCSMVIFRLS